MKKLWVICLALVLAVTFALPAAAYQVKIGARIKTEIMYSWRTGTAYGAPNWRQDGGRYGPGGVASVFTPASPGRTWWSCTEQVLHRGPRPGGLPG